MSTLRRFFKPIAIVVIAAMTSVSVPIVPAYAALVGTDSVMENAQTARAKVDAFLNRDDVVSKLQSLGVSPEEAKARVSALSDAEIQQIAGRIDTMPAGEGVVTSIIAAAVLLFIVLVITDLVGLTEVFGFTKKGSLNPN